MEKQDERYVPNPARIKEAAGALTDNDKLRAKGEMDQTVGHIKEAAKKGVRKARGTVRKIVDRATN